MKDVTLLNKEKDKFNKNMWIADSGAMCHMRNNNKGMFDIKDIQEEITMGNKENDEGYKSWKVERYHDAKRWH